LLNFYNSVASLINFCTFSSCSNSLYLSNIGQIIFSISNISGALLINKAFAFASSWMISPLFLPVQIVQKLSENKELISNIGWSYFLSKDC
jgi:hypothetical protein